MKPLIQKLVETPGPSGYEAQVRSVVRAEVEPFADDVRVDNLGNLIVRKGDKQPDGLRIMLAAHIDEIGVIITHIDDSGFARFLPVGGVRAAGCLGSRLRFLNGACGVIGSERLSDPSKNPAFEQMFIDFGVSDRKECPVRVGDMAVFERPYQEFGQRLVAKALDDRIGVAILIETLRQIHQPKLAGHHELYFVFSVQEEVGARGATTAAFGIDPDVGLAVDVTGTGDTPRGLKMEVSLGKGPAIKVRDQGMLSDPRLVRWLVQTAESARVPYQTEILELGWTDGKSIQLTRAGVPAGCISIPARYIHTPSEMVDFNDAYNAVRLLVELLRKPISLD
ncbi:MAG: aminopeptidase [Chloroflexi bacterium RBG_16_57_11]|nr:MAG: aminopeptidase [Chloroflexi bacterium RBG_16_57_11]